MPIDYQVQQGDCLDSIAFAHDFFPATLWNHALNAGLRGKRKDSNILHPGDVLVIPDKREKVHEAPSDQRHRFRRKGIPKVFSVQVKRVSGTPYRNKPYEFVVDDGPPRSGETDGDGWLRHYILPSAREARVTVADLVLYFDLGHLDPVSEVSGVQGRLRILRYYSGQIDGKIGEDTAQSIKAFQMLHELEVTGEVTEQLRTLLVEEAGS